MELVNLVNSVIIFLSLSALLKLLIFLNFVSVSIDFPISSKRDAFFQLTDFDYSHSGWDGFREYINGISRPMQIFNFVN